MVDEKTRMKWAEFYKQKNDIVEPTCEKFNKWKQERKPDEIMQCNGGGEKKTLMKSCNGVDWKLNINVEWTTQNTPQQNSPAEVAITTIVNHGRAMMIAANMHYVMQFRVYC